ncbi:unnamed protein product [Protopolystoma xenopodis]|uniref:Uncharacterized protein n=1 Tax=Protopolystoma xenopodis TaxID=117903 RepID=A0A3S5AWB6_9PLAT|nr:unnamed protein product [Protopolystoma xenopodis]
MYVDRTTEREASCELRNELKWRHGMRSCGHLIALLISKWYSTHRHYSQVVQSKRFEPCAHSRVTVSARRRPVTQSRCAK